MEIVSGIEWGTWVISTIEIGFGSVGENRTELLLRLDGGEDLVIAGREFVTVKGQRIAHHIGRLAAKQVARDFNVLAQTHLHGAELVRQRGRARRRRRGCLCRSLTHSQKLIRT